MGWIRGNAGLNKILGTKRGTVGVNLFGGALTILLLLVQGRGNSLSGRAWQRAIQTGDLRHFNHHSMEGHLFHVEEFNRRAVEELEEDRRMARQDPELWGRLHNLDILPHSPEDIYP
jgi:hypothetical protein